MSSWGFLEGLGAGMQQLGGSVFKAKVLDKLKEEEDIRKEQRTEARELAKVAETTIEQGAGGEYWKVTRNSQGTELERVLAPKNEIEKIRTQENKERIGLETAALNLHLAERKAGDYDEDRELSRRSIEATIGQREAAAVRSLRPPVAGRGRGSAPAAPQEKREYILEVKKQGKEMMKEAGLTEMQADGFAELAVNRAIIDKIDPIRALKMILKEHEAGK